MLWFPSQKITIFLFVILASLTFLGQQSFAGQEVVEAVSEISTLPSVFQPHLMTHCAVLDRSGSLLWQFPYEHCHFADDGSFVAATGQFLFFFNHKSELLKKLELYPHHDIFKMRNGDYIVLGSQFVTQKDKVIRYDTVSRFSESGVLKGQFVFDEESFLNPIVRKRKLKIRTVSTEWLQNENKGAHEHTHANSAYEDASGQVWVYMGVIKIVAKLSSDLKKINSILHHNAYTFHDVQPQRNGSILVYVNKLRKESNRSTLALYNKDLDILEQSWEFKNPDFYSEFGGGVQLIGEDFILFSEYKDKTTIVSIYDRKAQIKYKLNISDSLKRKNPIQSIKNTDLTKFLKNNRKL